MSRETLLDLKKVRKEIFRWELKVVKEPPFANLNLFHLSDVFIFKVLKIMKYKETPKMSWN